MQFINISKHISNFLNIKILCVGDIMLDRFFYGSVDRISPEGPVPVFLIKRKNSTLGGAGNVVNNLSSLGIENIFLSVIGDDKEGEELEKALEILSPGTSFLYKDKDRKTTVKTRYLSSGQQLLRVDKELVAPISSSIQNQIVTEFLKNIEKVDAVILSDYSKGLLTDNLLKRLISLAKKAKKFIAVDPQGNNYNKYSGVDILTPNLKELGYASNMVIKSVSDIINSARYLINSTGIKNILVTRGKEGMSLVAMKDVIHFPTHAQEVYDVSGAGDTVVALLASVVGTGASLIEAVKLANLCAGIVVGKAGTASLTKSEVFSAAHKFEQTETEQKVVLRERAVEKVINWHMRGDKVGFTNGCFDLLHPGHISLLKKAKSTCDRLIVGLNSDSSIKRLKGDSRPIQAETARSTVLSSLSVVDLVVIFEEDTPLSLIEILCPDVLIKGADYKIDEVVGADFIKRHGGQIKLVELEEGYSTTDTITKIIT